MSGLLYIPFFFLLDGKFRKVFMFPSKEGKLIYKDIKIGFIDFILIFIFFPSTLIAFFFIFF